MEKFAKGFPSRPFKAKVAKPWALAGVVGSGNLEVLLERSARPSDKLASDTMECHVETSIPGYKASWLAALADFAHHYAAGGTRVTINDQGAPPVLVTLRLRQAYDHLTKGEK
jgi:malonate decarboxylase acyl carrier protein